MMLIFWTSSGCYSTNVQTCTSAEYPTTEEGQTYNSSQYHQSRPIYINGWKVYVIQFCSPGNTYEGKKLDAHSQNLYTFQVHGQVNMILQTTIYDIHPCTARTLFRAPQLKDATIGEIKCVVQKECKNLCSHSPSPSVFHTTPVKGLKHFGEL